MIFLKSCDSRPQGDDHRLEKKRDKNLEIKKLSNLFWEQKFLSKQRDFYGFDSEVFI